ncbi:hypothetical protein LCGC14_0791600 [marine sediment metagenome]|uniref:Uncharacterized protein n=1 Tax=marine sediment metagenome TaxID=412755 RepID=A0A0F9PWP5_9ZZZZ
MKGGITKRVEETVKALQGGQLKKALYLTGNNEKLKLHRGIVEEAARTCLANKDNREVCQVAMNEATDKVKDTITLPIEDTSLEGVEAYLSPGPAPADQEAENKPSSEQTDEELYEGCEECHVAVAASRFADICAEHPEEGVASCKLISEKLEDDTTEPADWIRAMVETAEQAQGEAKEQMVAAVTDLTGYLEGRDSPLLKELDKGESFQEGPETA